MKKVACSVLVILLVFMCCSCRNSNFYWKEKHPCDQPGTEWATEDNGVSFTIPINDDEPTLGCIKAEEGEIIIQLYWDMIGKTNYVTYTIHDIDDLITPDEQWVTKSVSKKKFVVVIKESNYFEVNEELVFYRQ